MGNGREEKLEDEEMAKVIKLIMNEGKENGGIMIK
jgi:hypothetical protein